MKLKRRTPRSDMVHSAIILRMSEFNESLAGELGVDVSAAEVELSRFAYLSARVDFDNKEIDFDLAQANDTTDEMRDKFIKYLDTESMDIIIAAREGLSEMDFPTNPALAPEKPTEKK